jgi:hypothetical protein
MEGLGAPTEPEPDPEAGVTGQGCLKGVAEVLDQGWMREDLASQFTAVVVPRRVEPVEIQPDWLADVSELVVLPPVAQVYGEARVKAPGLDRDLQVGVFCHDSAPGSSLAALRWLEMSTPKD